MLIRKYLYPILGLCLPMLTISPTSMAAGNHDHRQHDAHEHGAAQLNIAQEGDTLHLELSSPAMNILGFEHKPRNNKQQQVLEAAIKQLKLANKLFVLTRAAACKVSKVEVDAGHMVGHDSEHTQHHHEEGHSDITAHYVFKCQQASKLSEINLVIFTLFPGIEELNVQLLSDKGQRAFTLHAKQTVINLK